MKKRIHYILIIAGLILPQMLLGQNDDSEYTIIGQAFRQATTPPGFPLLATMMLPLPDSSWATIVSDRDTLRTELDSIGVFTISGIKSKQVSLTVNLDINDSTQVMYYGTLDLMPGKNILLITLENFFDGWPSANHTVVTQNGDDWVYSYPSYKGPGTYVADLLKDLPGATYNKRKGTISVPSNGIHRAYVNGAYIFGLEP